MIRILIVDDHLLLREGLKCVLRQYDSLQIMDEACDGESALRSLKSDKFDIVITDINMPKMNGIELVRRIQRTRKKVKCIILSAYADEGLIAAAVKAGAMGYILKSATAETIVAAIETVFRGGHYFDETMPKKLQKLAEHTLNNLEPEQPVLPNKSHLQGRKRSGRKKIIGLSVRELELLSMLSQGMSNRDIATKLYLSEKTVKNHLSNIYRKLEVEDRAQAICEAARQKIIIMQ